MRCGITIRVQRIDRSLLGGMQRLWQPLTRNVMPLQLMVMTAVQGFLLVSGVVMEANYSAKKTKMEWSD
jgi:hypothetical protein